MTDARLIPYIGPATRSHAKFFPRGPFVSIILVQGIVEAAWFTKTSGKFNFFGVKANATQIRTGQASKVETREYIHGKYVSQDDYFADYSSIEAGFDAHAILLTQPHYLECQLAQTPQEYAEALHTCGYASAPNYATLLIEIMNEQNLYQYDNGAIT